MKVEDQVVSLELSKKLKELGVKQESYFYWYVVNDGDGIPPEVVPQQKQYTKTRIGEYKDGSGKWEENYYSAYTVAELGEMLPAEIKHNGNNFGFDCGRLDTGKWRMTYTNNKLQEYVEVFDEATEADARAKMLIYLLENNLITP